MKHDDETENMEIFKKYKFNLRMPHINPTNQNFNVQDNKGYIDKNYDYGYGYYDEQSAQGTYINVKQLNCIQKRKMRREYLDTLMAEQKNNYLHESRHRHAMQRKRAPSGRFLTKEETLELNKKDGL
ncbi:ccaat-binding transcription factor subunit hapb [Vairimorpha apis BRL 01]|uniref:Transcriptional activator HAP2 n=1 Tax=Vairimorpha apis BRL 01 TaxID=1037528 RepID=T0MFU7_9MICR|nr:ccaat-binding transcription factor subunit hapb [Vairimorpha apis BRL 01]